MDRVRLVIATDGYCAPNPGGRATWTFLARDAATGALVASANGVAAESGGSSAVAEWRGAFEALTWLAAQARTMPVEDAVLRNDHVGVVRALAGESRVPLEPETRRLAQECRRLSREVERTGARLSFARVPRWENVEAAALALAAFRTAADVNPG